MKKIIMGLAALLISANIFAVGFDLEAGFIYGHNGLTVDKVKDAAVAMVFLPEEAKKDMDSVGFNVGCTFEFTDNFGLAVDCSFLFPVSEKASSEDESITMEYTNAFNFSGFVGPMFILPLTDTFKLRLGGGLAYDVDYLKNDIGSRYVTGTGEVTMAGFGVAAKVDGTFMFNDNMGINFGVITGVLGSNQIDTTLTYNGTTVNEKYDVDGHAGFVIADVSFLYRLETK